MNQRLLNFDVRPCDPSTSPSDVPRLTGQNKRILERLREGPATNVELCEIALKYTSRISDLRKAGYRITNTREAGGVTRYEME